MLAIAMSIIFVQYDSISFPTNRLAMEIRSRPLKNKQDDGEMWHAVKSQSVEKLNRKRS